MSKIIKISVSITPGQLEKIQKAVDRGDYASTSEVIRTALRGWELKEELQERERERLGRLWDEGIASGPAVDGPSAMAELARKYDDMAKPKRAKKSA